MNIQAWAERTLKTVEENGHSIRCVKMISVEGTPWERWEAPFPTPEDFARQVQTVCDALAEEWPKKQVQMLLVAEDTQGTAHSQCPFTVWGKNKAAGPGMFNNDGSRAMAEGMDQIAFTSPLSSDEIAGLLAGEQAMIDEIGVGGIVLSPQGQQAVADGAFGMTLDDIEVASYDPVQFVHGGLAAELVAAGALDLPDDMAELFSRTSTLRRRVDVTTVAVFAGPN